jgi:hypothetical protein
LQLQEGLQISRDWETLYQIHFVPSLQNLKERNRGEPNGLQAPPPKIEIKKKTDFVETMIPNVYPIYLSAEIS